MLAPLKGIERQSDEEKGRNKASNNLFSTVASRDRPPIESFFNWLNEKQKFKERKKTDLYLDYWYTQWVKLPSLLFIYFLY